jgi:hypothetical protein
MLKLPTFAALPIRLKRAMSWVSLVFTLGLACSPAISAPGDELEGLTTEQTVAYINAVTKAAIEADPTRTGPNLRVLSEVVSYQNGKITISKDVVLIPNGSAGSSGPITHYVDTAALEQLNVDMAGLSVQSFGNLKALSIPCFANPFLQTPTPVSSPCVSMRIDDGKSQTNLQNPNTVLTFPAIEPTMRVALAIHHLSVAVRNARIAVERGLQESRQHVNEPLPDIVAILNAATRQKIVFSKEDFQKAEAGNSFLEPRLVKDANSNDYADHGGGIRGAPAASSLGWTAENVFGLKDPRVELAYQRACALPYNETYYINFCAELGKFYEKRGDLQMALAVFTMAPKCVHETHVSARLGPQCLQQAAAMYSRTGDENNATRVYGELCSKYADECEEFNNRGGHANLASARAQWEANVQDEADQRKQDQEDRAERAQASDAHFNAVLGALQGLSGGNDPNAILNAGAQQAAALRAAGDASAARPAAVTQPRVVAQSIAPQPTYVSNKVSTAANSESPSPPPTTNPSGGAAVSYLTPLATSCVRQFFDPNTYNWLSFENNCGQAIYINYIPHRPGGWAMGGGMQLAPGNHNNTGLSSAEIDQTGGYDLYVCPTDSVPVDLSGNAFNVNVPQYRCKPQ